MDNKDPFAVDDVSRIIPLHVTRRITAQGGVFTIHPEPTKPFSGEGLMKFVVPKQECKAIKKPLNRLGTNRASMFPGPDEIARACRVAAERRLLVPALQRRDAPRD